ncbi:MAG: ATP-dependent Clp protease ATP-binding subunit ClpA [Hyphomicrobiales bacterium]|nr:ATP-dependent Clp protease ATP-binding subunit ClpA [Hyphomicrobiales bacterium]
MLSLNLERTLQQALAIAKDYSHEYATQEHLLLALSEDPDAGAILVSCNVDIELLQDSIISFLRNDLASLIVEGIIESKPTAGFQRVVHRAAVHANASGDDEITGANVLGELFSERDSHAAYFLQAQNISNLDVLACLSQGMPGYEYYPDVEENQSQGAPASDLSDDEQIANANEILEKYCINLNARARAGRIDTLIGRNTEIEDTVRILCRRTKNNPILVGDPGVGKTAIAEGLAYRITHNQVPDVLEHSIIYSLDLGSLVAGTRYRGDFEERLKSIIKAIQETPGAILFIDEIHTIIGAGSTSSGSMDASNLLKPSLARGDIRCIGSTTYKEYRSHFEKDRALARRFQKVDVIEPTVEDTIQILEGLKNYYEDHHDVRYSSDAIQTAAILSARYIHDKKLPDKAIDVLDEAGARHALLPAEKRTLVITVEDIEETVARMARIPSRSVSSNESERLQKLEERLKEQVFGQSSAVEAVVSSIKLSRAGLRKSTKPIGSYLFTGPTGVGKTELATKLAQEMAMHFVRVDMSEYMEQHSVSRLIGTPPGYVGFEQGGILTDALDQNPHTLLLLDEIEKAHPDIYNLLLQVMDYGKLTDNSGKTVDFRNAIIIMTSNAGAEEMSRTPIGFGRAEERGDSSGAIRRLFTPEFRNRLDAIIQFQPLEPKLMASIVDKFVDELRAQLADRGVRLDVSRDARNWLAENGYDRDNGARPLERLIEQELKRPLADEILFGKLKQGGTVKAGVKAGKLSFLFLESEESAEEAKEPVAVEVEVS